MERRTYQSTLRRQQAAATRSRILDAARVLFLKQGYGATTIAAIATHAGVATPTITGQFAGKRAILDEVLRATVRGGGAVPLTRPLRAAIAEDEARVVVRELARLIAEANHRAAEMFEITRKAATVEPDIEAVRQRGAADRRRDMIEIATGLDARGSLRPGLSIGDAADILWFYSSSDVYRLLVTDRRWSTTRFVTWLESTLTAALLEG